MTTFLKKIAVFIGIIAAVSLTINFTSSAPVSARELGVCGPGDNFIGMVPWDCGFQQIPTGASNAQDILVSNIVTIAMNVLTDFTVIAAYLVLGYVIYGGYLYIFSTGDPGKAAAGKKTLQHAFIGLAIVMSASVIFGAIRIAIIGNNALGSCDPLTGGNCVEPGDMVTNLIQWFIGVAGVVSAIFIVVGAWGYITASGDPGKLSKAKTTILYALIGLVIVALAEVLTSFISGIIRDANDNAISVVQDYHQNSLIVSKENI